MKPLPHALHSKLRKKTSFMLSSPVQAALSLGLPSLDIGYAQRIVSDLSPEKALRLELGGGLDEVYQLAVVCLLSTGLKFIWETRA